MATYKTPGVYVEEISTLPPSVAEVSTAIPAFIGYTAAGKKVARINTMLEYETIFGQAKPSAFTATTRLNPANGLTELVSIQRDTTAGATNFLMYYSLSLYFKNGGGSCYVISIGDYNATPAKADFEAGLAELEKEDEPTLILMTDAVNLLAADYYDLCQQALAQCNKLGDRFAILDVVGDSEEDFRNQIGTSNLMYGAAYYPYLQTSLSFQYTENEVNIKQSDAKVTVFTWQRNFDKANQGNGISVSYSGSAGATPQVKLIAGATGDSVTFEVSNQQLTLRNVAGKTGEVITTAWNTWKGTNNPQGFDISQNGTGSGEVDHTNNNFVALNAQQNAPTPTDTLKAIKSTHTALYNQTKAAMTQQRVVLPPSSAVAGVYATIDRERGV
ncbi:MAG: hypothetical protein U0401_34405 [Anaerolineae bacterium]